MISNYIHLYTILIWIVTLLYFALKKKQNRFHGASSQCTELGLTPRPLCL